MVAGIGIRDATAARGDTLEPAFEERLELHQKGARLHDLLGVDELLATTKLAGGNEVLDLREDHWNDCPRLGYTGDLVDHPLSPDLRVDLPEAGKQDPLTGPLGDQHAGRPHERIDDIADPKRELLYSPVDAGADDCFCQVHLRLGQRSLGAGFLRGEKGRYPFLEALFCSGRGSDCAQIALGTDLEPLDVPEGDVTWIASLQFLLGFQFVQGLLVSAFGLLDLAFGLQYISPRNQH